MELKAKIDSLIVQKLSLERTEAKLELQLQQVEAFNKLQEIKKQITDIDLQFRTAALDYLKSNNLESTTGPAGTITLVTRNNIKCIDIDKVPKDYKEKIWVPKMDVIKENIKLFGEEIPGIVNDKTEYVRITKNKELESC